MNLAGLVRALYPVPDPTLGLSQRLPHANPARPPAVHAGMGPFITQPGTPATEAWASLYPLGTNKMAHMKAMFELTTAMNALVRRRQYVRRSVRSVVLGVCAGWA